MWVGSCPKLYFLMVRSGAPSSFSSANSYRPEAVKEAPASGERGTPIGHRTAKGSFFLDHNWREPDGEWQGLANSCRNDFRIGS